MQNAECRIIGEATLPNIISFAKIYYFFFIIYSLFFKNKKNKEEIKNNKE